MTSLITAAYHQCNIFSNHFTYSPFTSSPSPSMTITIYHQHHYHHNYHHGLCRHSFHPAINHPLLYAMCPLFVSLCVSVQTYSIIVPAEAVWQPDQLHFDDARACLLSPVLSAFRDDWFPSPPHPQHTEALHCVQHSVPWVKTPYPFQLCNDYFDILKGLVWLW